VNGMAGASSQRSSKRKMIYLAVVWGRCNYSLRRILKNNLYFTSAVLEKNENNDFYMYGYLHCYGTTKLEIPKASTKKRRKNTNMTEINKSRQMKSSAKHGSKLCE